MNRRDALKAISASAVVTGFGKPQAAFFEIPEKRKLIAFVNENVMPVEQFAKIKLPVDVTFVPIRLADGLKFEDAIRIYELSGE